MKSERQTGATPARPPVARRTYRIRGKPISDTVIEDRR